MGRSSLVAVIVAVSLALGCNTPHTPSPFQYAFPGPPVTIRNVTGTVWVHTAASVEPGRYRSILATLGGNTGFTKTLLTSDGDGRYQVEVTQPSQLFLRALEGHQPCVAHFHFGGAAVVDIHVVEDLIQLGANLPSALVARGETLSGRVFERSGAVQIPVSGAQVDLGGSELDVGLASTLTDQNGQYVICNATLGPIRASKPFYYTASRSDHYDVFGFYFLTTTVDIEIRRGML